MALIKIHHIGYAVKDINKSINKFAILGWVVDSICDDEIRNCKIAFLHLGDVSVEFVASLSLSLSLVSPVDEVVRKNGSTPYHICYEVDDMMETISMLKHEGFFVIKDVEIALAIPSPKGLHAVVAFLYQKDVGLIELVSFVKNER